MKTIFLLSLVTILYATPDTNKDTAFISSSIDPLLETECIEIFNKLKKAKGLLHTQSPQLKIQNGLGATGFAMAMYDPSDQTITLDRKMIAMCNDSLGSNNTNGMAFLLSHEIGHYLKKHNHSHPVIKRFQNIDSISTQVNRQLGAGTKEKPTDLSIIKKEFQELSSKFNTRKNEAEADLEAGFISYVAGYNSLDAGPDFLSAAYNYYGLPKKGGKYPSLVERQEIIKNATLELDTLKNVFETGNFLNVAGHYSEAVLCYEYILKKYQSSSLLNNIGSLILYQVSDKINHTRVKYVLPITLNLAPVSAARDVLSIEEALRIEKRSFEDRMPMLLLAEQYFTKALTQDEYSISAFLNRSICLYLQHVVNLKHPNNASFKEDQLLFFAFADAIRANETALQYAKDNKNLTANSYVQLAIIANEINKIEKSKKALNKGLLINPKNNFVIKNIQIINGNKLRFDEKFKFESSGLTTCAGEEKINDNSVTEILQSNETKWESTVVLDKIKGHFVDTEIKLNIGKGSDYTFFNWSRKNGTSLEKRISLIKTNPNYNGKTGCGTLSIKSNASELSTHYGIEGKEKATTGSNLIWYEKGRDPNVQNTEFSISNGVIFSVSDQDKIESWVLYQKAVAF